MFFDEDTFDLPSPPPGRNLFDVMEAMEAEENESMTRTEARRELLDRTVVCVCEDEEEKCSEDDVVEPLQKAGYHMGDDIERSYVERKDGKIMVYVVACDKDVAGKIYGDYTEIKSENGVYKIMIFPEFEPSEAFFCNYFGGELKEEPASEECVPVSFDNLAPAEEPMGEPEVQMDEDVIPLFFEAKETVLEEEKKEEVPAPVKETVAPKEAKSFVLDIIRESQTRIESPDMTKISTMVKPPTFLPGGTRVTTNTELIGRINEKNKYVVYRSKDHTTGKTPVTAMSLFPGRKSAFVTATKDEVQIHTVTDGTVDVVWTHDFKGKGEVRNVLASHVIGECVLVTTTTGVFIIWVDPTEQQADLVVPVLKSDAIHSASVVGICGKVYVACTVDGAEQSLVVTRLTKNGVENSNTLRLPGVKPTENSFVHIFIDDAKHVRFAVSIEDNTAIFTGLVLYNKLIVEREVAFEWADGMQSTLRMFMTGKYAAVWRADNGTCILLEFRGGRFAPHYIVNFAGQTLVNLAFSLVKDHLKAFVLTTKQTLVSNFNLSVMEPEPAPKKEVPKEEEPVPVKEEEPALATEEEAVVKEEHAPADEVSAPKASEVEAEKPVPSKPVPKKKAKKPARAAAAANAPVHEPAHVPAAEHAPAPSAALFTKEDVESIVIASQIKMAGEFASVIDSLNTEISRQIASIKADTSKQIVAMKNDILKQVAVKGQIGKLESCVFGVKGQVQSLQSKMDNLQKQIDKVEAGLSEKITEVSELVKELPESEDVASGPFKKGSAVFTALSKKMKGPARREPSKKDIFLGAFPQIVVPFKRGDFGAMINTAVRDSPDAVLLTFKYLLSEEDVKQMCLMDGESRLMGFGVADFVRVVSALVRSAEEHPIFAWKWVRVLVELALNNSSDYDDVQSIMGALAEIQDALGHADPNDHNVRTTRGYFSI